MIVRFTGIQLEMLEALCAVGEGGGGDGGDGSDGMRKHAANRIIYVLLINIYMFVGAHNNNDVDL